MSDVPAPEAERAGFCVISHAEMLYLSAIRLLSERVGQARPEAATGFVVADDGDERFLVTARHVVDGVARTTLHLYTGETVDTMGPPVMYEIRGDEEFWTFHPDAAVDVAVGRFEPISEFFDRHDQRFVINAISWRDFYAPIPAESAGFIGKFLHPLPLDEVLIVGYPLDYRDTPTSLPVLRRGHIATPLWLDHEDRPVFLVDTAANPGSSGGPVAYVEEEHNVGRHMYEGTGKIVLLGVLSEVFPPRGRTANVADGQPQRPPNLAAVYKAETILEAIAATR